MQQLAGPNIMLMGPSGTGKTYALGELVEWGAKHGKQVCVLFTENGLETLLGYWRDAGKEVPENLAWHQAFTRPLDLKALIKGADNVGKLSYEALTKMSDPNRSGENNAFLKILTALSDFPDDRTGKRLGSVDSWGLDKIFVIDSLSELANAATKMVIGNKPTMAPPDYGVAQNNLMNFIRLCTQGVMCTFVITAHVTRETDEISGSVKIMVKSIGKALAGDIPQLFSDVIYTVREGTNFYWDTAAANADTKTRNLPIKAKQAPSFNAVMEKWSSRGVV
jgi:archaellum biogenesis ATPase FlaH